MSIKISLNYSTVYSITNIYIDKINTTDIYLDDLKNNYLTSSSDIILNNSCRFNIILFS